MAALLSDKALNRVFDLRFKELETQTLTLSPLEKDKFSALASQRTELFLLIKEMEGGVLLGKQARKKMEPGYQPPSPHAV